MASSNEEKNKEEGSQVQEETQTPKEDFFYQDLRDLR